MRLLVLAISRFVGWITDQTVFLRLLLVLLLPSSLFGDLPAAGWREFRGGPIMGNLGRTVLPATWNEKQGVRWKTELSGRGHASPVHDGKTAWLATASIDGKSLGAIAVDLDSGAVVHTVTALRPQNVEEIHHDNTYASPTPCLSNGRLYLHFGTYGTACVDTRTAQVLWTNTSLPVEHQGGPGSSPVIAGDLLILTLDGADSQKVVALNTSDGSIRWQRARSAPQRENPITKRAFATPVLIPHQGRPVLLSPGADQLHAYDAETGEELWHVRYVGFSTVPQPVADDQSCYFCTGYFKPELWSVRLGGTGNVTDTHLKWKFKGPVPDVPSPCLADGTLYIISNTGVATAVDAESGERKWVLRVGGNYWASPFTANGLLYFCSEDGAVKVVDPRLEKPKIVEVNRLEGSIHATPAVIGNELLIRTDKFLYRISGPAGTPETP